MRPIEEFNWSDMVFKKEKRYENIKVFCGQGEKGQAVFLPLVLLCGHEGVVQNWRRKDDRKRAGEGRLLGRIGVKGFSYFRRGLGKYV